MKEGNTDMDYYVKFKDLSLYQYVKKGPLADVEGLLHMIVTL